MKKVLLLLSVMVALSTGLAFAQDAPTTPQATAHVWVDAFGGKDGVVIYPQYAWSLETSAGKVTGFGFGEGAPHEPLFTNHLLVFSPGKQNVFSVHTETGGLPADGRAFFQAGPRVNIHEAVPKLKGTVAYLFVAVLPHLEGIRTNNVLVSGATKPVPIVKSVEFSLEAYRRFFLDGPDYSEYWYILHPKGSKLSYAVFVLIDGNRASLAFGGRFSAF